MTGALEIVFWLSLTAIIWTYAGYPALLYILSALQHRTIRSRPIEPSVTLIIAAYNEEKGIAAKLQNSLKLDYPPEKLQILVASDCSTDGTHAIVRSFPGVELLALPERGGKTAAQNAAVAAARGEIVIFTDASTEFEADMPRRLMEKFADPRVGCVGAELEYVTEEGSAIGRGNHAYWRYEKKVKEMEAAVNTLIGVSGCLYAVRRSLYRDIAPDMISDFVISPEIYSRRHITVYGQGVVSREKTLENAAQEFSMRVRIAVRTINALIRYGHMLNPLRYGFFSVQLFSHKVLRYLVPHLLLFMLLSSCVLAVTAGSRQLLYQFLLIPQFAVYGGALLGWLAQQRGWRIRGVHIPFYFIEVNLAAFWALILYLGGERKTIWTPIR